MGVYTLSVRVDDGDGGIATATHTVTVALVTADAGPDLTIDEGSSVSLGWTGVESHGRAHIAPVGLR